MIQLFLLIFCSVRRGQALQLPETTSGYFTSDAHELTHLRKQAKELQLKNVMVARLDLSVKDAEFDVLSGV